MTEFDEKNFQNQVLKEVRRLSNASSSRNETTQLATSANNEIIVPHKSAKPHSKPPRWFSSRKTIYSEIQRELQKPLLFFSKDKISKLIAKLINNDSLILERTNRDLQKRITDLENNKLKAQREEMYQIQIDITAKDEATKVIFKKDVRKYLCPILQSASKDANDIAKLITPILVPLILAGTLTIPLEPIIFAHLAMIIARMGVASMCDDYMEKEKMPNDVNAKISNDVNTKVINTLFPISAKTTKKKKK